MGFLDRMIKNAVRDVISDKISDALGQSGAPVPGQQEAYQQAVQAADSRFAPATPTAPAALPRICDDRYFRDILAENFPEYELHPLLPVETFGGSGRPYTFALVANGGYAGVVMLVAHNRDNNRAYTGARAAAQAAGVPFINFYTHMPNERDYVINRVRRLAKPAA